MRAAAVGVVVGLVVAPGSCAPLAPPQSGETDDGTDLGVRVFFTAFFYVIFTFLVFGLIRMVFVMVRVVIVPSFRSIRLTNESPGQFDDEQLQLEEDNRALTELTPNEQEVYFQTKDFMALNPVDSSAMTAEQTVQIVERGIQAWEFKPNAAVAAELVIQNKTELQFCHSSPQSELSVQTNLPLPATADVYYFEAKIMSVPRDDDDDTAVISIGLATSPYPYFRLPGRHRQSISYDSNGDRRFNQCFPLKPGAGLRSFPALHYGDVVGIGYRVRSGTVFFTRNGKKVSESKIGGHVTIKNAKLYPTVGATDRCTVHVNVGQSGYVFIEANVKKWGFAPLEGSGPPPPAYKTFNEDVLLESSSEYSDGEDSFPPNFWSATQGSLGDEERDADENITLNTLPADPPLYRSGSGGSGSGSGSDSGSALHVARPGHADAHSEMRAVSGSDDDADADADEEDNSEHDMDAR